MDRAYFWLSEEQFARLEPHLPSDMRGKPRGDDCPHHLLIVPHKSKTSDPADTRFSASNWRGLGYPPGDGKFPRRLRRLSRWLNQIPEHPPTRLRAVRSVRARNPLYARPSVQGLAASLQTSPHSDSRARLGSCGGSDDSSARGGENWRRARERHGYFGSGPSRGGHDGEPK
jgi:hypothetical protein